MKNIKTHPHAFRVKPKKYFYSKLFSKRVVSNYFWSVEANIFLSGQCYSKQTISVLRCKYPRIMSMINCKYCFYFKMLILKKTDWQTSEVPQILCILCPLTHSCLVTTLPFLIYMRLLDCFLIVDWKKKLLKSWKRSTVFCFLLPFKSPECLPKHRNVQTPQTNWSVDCYVRMWHLKWLLDWESFGHEKIKTVEL